MPLSRDRLFSNNVKRYAEIQTNHKLGLGFVAGHLIQPTRHKGVLDLNFTLIDTHPLFKELKNVDVVC